MPKKTLRNSALNSFHSAVKIGAPQHKTGIQFQRRNREPTTKLDFPKVNTLRVDELKHLLQNR